MGGEAGKGRAVGECTHHQHLWWHALQVRRLCTCTCFMRTLGRGQRHAVDLQLLGGKVALLAAEDEPDGGQHAALRQLQCGWEKERRGGGGGGVGVNGWGEQQIGGCQGKDQGHADSSSSGAAGALLPATQACAHTPASREGIRRQRGRPCHSSSATDPTSSSTARRLICSQEGKAGGHTVAPSISIATARWRQQLQQEGGCTHLALPHAVPTAPVFVCRAAVSEDGSSFRANARVSWHRPGSTAGAPTPLHPPDPSPSAP